MTHANYSALRFSLKWLLGLTAVVAIPLALCVAFNNCLQNAHRQARASATRGHFSQVQLALSTYHDVHGHFPPAYIADANGKPMHSWRVLILPYLEHQDLYDQYDFNEPWDGPNNSLLIDKMPLVFSSIGEEQSTRFTNIVVINGKDTAFPGEQTTSLEELSDGAENTILIAETTESKIVWTSPIDIDGDKKDLLEHDTKSIGISSVSWRNPYVAFADRITAYSVDRNIPADKLKALTTINGQEDTSRDKMVDQGYLSK